jgi:hypothetical protein
MRLLANITAGSCGLALCAGLFAAEPGQSPGAVRQLRCSFQNDASYHLLCEEHFRQTAPRDEFSGASGDAQAKDVLEFVDRHDPLRTIASDTQAKPAAPAPARLWRIPLYNIPFHSNDVVVLVRAVMCSRSAPCEVTLDGSFQ